jgi:hypothetical protein
VLILCLPPLGSVRQEQEFFYCFIYQCVLNSKYFQSNDNDHDHNNRKYSSHLLLASYSQPVRCVNSILSTKISSRYHYYSVLYMKKPMPKELCDLSKASTTMTSQKYFYVLNKTDTIHFGNPWTLETLTVTGIVGSAMNTR